MKKLLGIFLILVLLISSACSSGSTPTPTQAPTQAKPTPTPTLPVVTPQQPIATASAPTDIKTNPTGVEYLTAMPLTQAVKAIKAPLKTSKPTLVPVITWGGDVATILANGGIDTKAGSIFANEGLSIKLFREDNFVRATEKVITGDTPYLRGTVDMVTDAIEALNDRGIEMVVIYQETWSTGGDHIVWKNTANVAALKGKNIALQLYGPHMLYLATALKDAGLTPNDVNIKWVRELTLPPYDTKGVAVDPASAWQKDSTLDAVTVITPDSLALTANTDNSGIGSGAEGSVKGATKGMSTFTAGRIIADVYAVRKDYLTSNKDDVQKFVHGLMLATEQLAVLVGNHNTQYQELMKTSAVILRDNEQAIADIEGLLLDCTFVGYTGNVLFFNKDTSGQIFPRNFDVITKEAQDALKGYGLLTKTVSVNQANWEYTLLATGLTNTSGVMIAKFDPTKVEQYVKEGTYQEGTLFSFEIKFQPNQVDFPIEKYQIQFDKIIAIASTYPGAIIIVEGHADPTNYLSAQSKNATQQILDQIRQSAKNLSMNRALAVRSSIITYAKSKNLILDSTQFTPLGSGIEHPLYAVPQNETQYLENMRVVFQIIQVEAESDRFVPIGSK